MSLEELWMLEEAHVRNEAADTVRAFDPLIAYFAQALCFSKKDRSEARAFAEKIKRDLEERSEFGLDKRKV